MTSSYDAIVERVARIIDPAAFAGLPRDSDWSYATEAAREKARAAYAEVLMVLEEPTPAMNEAGYRAHFDWGYEPIWQAMLRAAPRG